MKRLSITLLTLLSCSAAMAGKHAPASAGEEFARINTCKDYGQFTGVQKDLASKSVADEHRVQERSDLWKHMMNIAKENELERLDEAHELEIAALCHLIKNKYL